MIKVKKAYAGQNLDFANYAVAITSADSNLDKLAKSEGWMATFPMYDIGDKLERRNRLDSEVMISEMTAGVNCSYL